MKLFKKIALVAVGATMAIGVGLSLNGSQLIQADAASVVYYTADYSKASAITAGAFTSTYSDEETVTLTDGTYAKEWKSYGANTNNYAVAGTRFGGKNAGLLTSAVTNAPAGITTGAAWYAMYIAGTAQFGQEVTKLEVTSIGTFGTASFVVGKKMILQVSANADFSSSTEYETTMVASGTHTFNAPTSWASTSYYRIVMERNSTSSTNSGIILSNLKFYAEMTVIDVSSVAITEPATTSLVVGDSAQLTATVLPADATDKSLSWSSSDSNIVEVDQTGKITAISTGNATITATSVQNEIISDDVAFSVSSSATFYDKTITATGFEMLSTYVDGNYDSNGVVYYAYQVMKSTNSTTLNALQFRGNPTGYLYNKTVMLNDIKSITIRLSSGNTVTDYALYVGSSSNPSSAITVTGVADTDIPSIITYDVSALGNYKFFKFAKTTTSGTLYVDAIVVEMVETDVESARTFANSFLTSLDAECSALNVSSATWASLSSSYDALNAAAKLAFTSETSTVAATKVQRALERYSYIVNKYGYTNFMGITIQGSASPTLLDTTNFSSSSIIVLIAMTSFVVVGSMFFFKKKKEVK